METAADVLLVLVGVTLVLAVYDSALRTFVLPRGVSNPLTRITYVSLRWVFAKIARESRTYETRDRIMALYGPISLFILVFVWMLIVITGYTLIFRAVIVDTWHDAIELSGSSFFTLGFELPPRGLPGYVVVFTEAATGLAILALLIAYLPTIYGAFSRREREVSRLATIAGTPPSAVELLVRYHKIGWNDQLPTMWLTWEQWFAELGETHASLAVLTFFRSPSPHRSWVTAAGAVLDAASLAQSTLAVPWSPQAGLCIRSGFLAFHEIADYFDIPYDPDPPRGAPISIARAEFDAAYEQMASEGVPVRPDRDRCWRDFCGWRVNYDALLLALAGLTMAPYAPWSSDRSLRVAPPRVFRIRPRLQPPPASGPTPASPS
ncbi:MAG: hypothetical protein WEC34_15445 [Acidimicrobiia bacterium]